MALNFRLDQIRTQIHREMLAEMDLRRLEGIPLDLLKRELKSLAERLISAKNVPVNEAELRQIVQGIQNEILGLGPIEPLLADNSVSDILVNGPYKVFVERRGKIEPTDVRFDSEAHLLRVIDRIVSRIGRRIDEMSPMVDARLSDAHASTRSSRRWPSMGLCCRSAALPWCPTRYTTCCVLAP